MTGTSCDGADLALLRFDIKGASRGVKTETLVHTASKNFPAALRAELREAQKGRMSIAETARLTERYSSWISEYCADALRRWRISPQDTLIAVHGQTVWHEPQNRISVQLLDASIVACATKCTVTFGFRQPDLARGGQGAPLVPYYHWLRAHSTVLSRHLPLAINNVGGISNLTYVTNDIGEMIAFDTGPGNALIDMAVEKFSRGKLKFDAGGKIAAGALNEIDWHEIESLGKLPYFKAKPPKSTGRELFNETFLKRLPGRGAVLVANATAFTAHTMAKAYADFVLTKGNELSHIFVAGGGAKNQTLLKLFSREIARLTRREIIIMPLPGDFAPAQSLEAMAFARFGIEALQGKPVSIASITGAKHDAFGAAIVPGENYKRLLKLLDVI